MKLGIVGLPNVGKSTLFNALTNAGAESANYPFCTIEPNVGVVTVPDKRLDYLEKMYNSEKTSRTTLGSCGSLFAHRLVAILFCDAGRLFSLSTYGRVQYTRVLRPPSRSAC